METNEKALEVSSDNWRKGVASVEDVRSLAQDLGAYLYTPGIPALLELMEHKDEIVRSNAAGSIGSNFVYTPATSRLLKMLANDPDEDCRSMAASSLASLCHDTKDRVVLAALGKAALDDPDEFVRDSAYQSLLFVDGLPQEKRQEVFRNFPHVDPDRVKAILAQVSE